MEPTPLCKVLVLAGKEIPRTLLHQLIKLGSVKVNGEVVKDFNVLVKRGDEITIGHQRIRTFTVT